MVFLPEASDFIAPSASYSSLAESLDDSTFLKGIRESAKDNDCWVQVGVHEKAPDNAKCYNTLVMVSPKGLVEQAYRKLHLFDIDFSKTINANESKYISPGKEHLTPVQTPAGKVGQLICYDMRFPEVGLMHRKKGAEILTYPSAFTMRTGAAHWEVLLRARAIENQCYVIAAAQVGAHLTNPLRQSWGHSLIVDPFGTIIAQVPDTLPDGEEAGDEWGTSFALAEVDGSGAELEKIRRAMPLWDQRREDTYPLLGERHIDTGT